MEVHHPNFRLSFPEHIELFATVVLRTHKRRLKRIYIVVLTYMDFFKWMKFFKAISYAC